MALFFIVIIVAIVICIVLVAKPNQGGDKPSQTVDVDKMLADLDTMKRKAELLIQSKIVGDDKTYQSLMNDTYDGPLPEDIGGGRYLSLYDNLRILKIAGINHRQGINRYMGRVMCDLVPEPYNEFDPDALKIVAKDKHHIGYVPSDQTDFVRSMADGTFPYPCEAHVYESEEDGRKFFYGFVYILKKDKG